ncbi:MAG: exodeoxyribonuclease VII small subunit [Planctomycetia bacterium]
MASRTKKAEGTGEAGEEPSFEQRLEALEAIVQDLEAEGLSLEQSLARYQQGVAHVNACRALLDAAEKRLVELADTPAGPRERRLKVGEQGLVGDEAAPGRDADDDDR